MPDMLDPKFVDKRTAPRYLRQGLLDDKAYEKYLKSLPDLAEQAIKVEADLTATEVDDDIDDEEDDAPPGGV